MTDFDYIVVGAGTAGCVLAARLSEDPGAQVLLLEAGHPERTRAMTVPGAWPDNLGSEADWAGVTTAQADVGPVMYPRGRALGGSGAINAMAHVRGHRAVYDGWAATGAAGWGSADLLPYFRRSEHLTVRSGCLVTGLQLRHGRCDGVVYLRDGAVARAQASAEVIVCAGAVGSPQLLMLSGVGPADSLRALGIDPVADLPVGRNLQDHPVGMACYASGSPLPRSRYNHGEVYAALRSPLAGDYPDLHLFPVLLPVVPPGRQPPAHGFALLVSAVAPDSRGSVRLASAAPQAAPLVDPGFLRDGRDLDRLETGLTLIRQATAGAAFSGLTELWPGAGVRAAAELRGYLRSTVSSYYHPAGTCRMGSGPDAVVDPALRVRGFSGLRVADASVLPVIPNAHLNATVLAIAEKAAELISRAA